MSQIKEMEKETFDWYHIPLDDAEVYRYFQNSWNSEVFQFGSNLLINYCKILKPTEINDLIAAVSLVRPGALNSGSHLKYVKRGNREGKR